MTADTTSLPDTVQDRLRAHHDYAIVAVTYPYRWRTGSEFVRTRVEGYARAGLRGIVVDYSPLNSAQAHVVDDPAAPIVAIRPDELPSALEALASSGTPVLAHSPTPTAIGELLAKVPAQRLATWFHGYEVRDYRRLHGNTTTKELFAIRHIRDAQNTERFRAARPLFESEGVTKVFVSDTQRRYSEFDVGVPAKNAEVIPNMIDTHVYRARERRPEEARNILLLRSFATHNYASDVAVRAIDICAQRNGFQDLSFTVKGYGRLFHDTVRPLRRLDNVVIEEGFSSPAQMAALYDAHGIALVPTRYDTQGVMLGEAMASGAVTVTNPVAAIPEFTDSNSSLLPRGNDPWAFAEAIWNLVEQPERVPPLSRHAADRAATQCGPAATTDRELELIRRLS